MRKFKKKTLAVCIAQIILLMGGITACGEKDGRNVPQQETVATSEAQQETVSQNEPQQDTAQTSEMQQETVSQNEPQQDTVQTSEMQQEVVLLNETQPMAAQASATQQNTSQPKQSSDEQISLETAKSVALADAGVSDADVIYTKEKKDFEDGIMVYEIEFYAGNTEYEYEINAITGTVYSKNMEVHNKHTGHNGNMGTSQTDIGADSARAIALNHAGFSETDVSHLKTEFDIDDGIAVYEIEFYKNGIEYEYTINAADGSIIEYEMD